MKSIIVKRIVANIRTSETTAAKIFYGDILGLDILMDHGWITTYGSDEKMDVQLSFAVEGGSGTEVPDLSIEVNDVDAVYQHMKKQGFSVEYGPADEPWNVRRIYVRDPFGKLINVLQHKTDNKK
ncbi:Glyoxalase/Bleomycin resistance protein/Dioxygenase superfamily protein [Chryseobacterium taichungense]|uniref:Glyoxalase/Bleomycin resistance protein/Dioxygenase superfamily protein n=1 Tax=Chryseobacterium taichungense TaxID=295069 RepID=A0A1H7XFY3_9FLAO|nr:VOC family protein [Chryseobacterium taichungense]SEM32641.1 Glyoxalase/Bleomycin resistance protein/Dioxygenase superfamily protein [Chryseobacterium taichungense]